MQVIPEVRDIRRFGAAALDLCLVASGRLDAYYEKRAQPVGLRRRRAHRRGGRARGSATSMAGLRRVSSCSLLRPGLFEPLRDLLDRAGARDA